jgi:uncharacterized membrane protein YdjX (TVP38/TMEM64 family)
VRGAKYAFVAISAIGLAYLLWVTWDHPNLMVWVREAQPWPFFVALALLPAVGVPTTPFFVIAGASFGTPVGLIGSLLALAFNLVMTYWLARSSVRPRLESLMRRFDYDIPDFRQRGKGSLRFALLVKLAPGIPTFVKNYGLAIANVPFAMYFVLSMLITGAYAAALIVLGESLFEHNVSNAVIAAVVIVALALALWWWVHRRESADHDDRLQLHAG